MMLNTLAPMRLTRLVVPKMVEAQVSSEYSFLAASTDTDGFMIQPAASGGLH